MNTTIGMTFGPAALFFDSWMKASTKMMKMSSGILSCASNYFSGVTKYVSDFAEPLPTALKAFNEKQKENTNNDPWKTIANYIKLAQANQSTANKGIISTTQAMGKFHIKMFDEALAAWQNTFFNGGGEDLETFIDRYALLFKAVAEDYPQAIQDIKDEYGLHTENGGALKVAETDRFYLYKILPLDDKIKIREEGKPILIIPPYVLGANILSFLPREGKSYVHSFAHQGVPTYLRVIKDINENPAVQTMTPEDDASDTRFFCEKLTMLHGRKVTLNGFCQGGFVSMVNVLSGILDDYVDALITCVTPMDGTRSAALTEYLEEIPEEFRGLDFATKELPNGNRVVDGKVMSWVYKLKSMESEAPLFAFYRDLMMFDNMKKNGKKISKTAAAVNYWLTYERNDLPIWITQMSSDSYNIPVDKDGNLPVKLFGKTLNFKKLEEAGIKLLMCIAERDNLVDREAALAPLDFIEAYVAVFPKGHGAIATSWSIPTDTVVHSGMGYRNLLCTDVPNFDCDIENCRNKGCCGPLRFHLEMCRKDEL